MCVTEHLSSTYAVGVCMYEVCACSGVSCIDHESSTYSITDQCNIISKHIIELIKYPGYKSD